VASILTEGAVPANRDKILPVIVDRVTRFLTSPQNEPFEDLALAAFAWQFERVEPFRRLCERRGVSPGTVTGWRQVPPVPTAAFKTMTLAAAPAVEIFRSSGTAEGEERRSVHHQPFPDLYRAVIDASFPRFCLPFAPFADARLPILSLIPTPEQLPDSSLSFMAGHILARWGGPESATAFGSRGVEAAQARSWAGARQRDLLARLRAWTGVPAASVVREYGMTELTSQCYTGSLLGEDPELFRAPHWVRVRILDPETLEEAPAGTPGLICVFDLANLGSAVHLLTEDLGVAEGEGFRLLGRAAGAELRGCSLVVEELRGAP
jgi:hypothetical protein